MNPRSAITAVGILAGLNACAAPPRSEVRPLTSGAAAERYFGEFVEMEKLYPQGERLGASSPTWDAAVALDHETGFLADESCHSIWLETPETPRQLIVRVRESDPGSGSSFGFGWSRDGRAVFLSGSHSGIDCPRERKAGALRIIYTLADRVAWEVPGRPSNSALHPPHSAVTLLAEQAARRRARG